MKGNFSAKLHKIAMLFISQKFKAGSQQTLDIFPRKSGELINLKVTYHHPPKLGELSCMHFIPLSDLGLLSLNNVVSALGDPRRNVSCIPYQDSLLSRLLREALGGSSLTVAVCTLSPLERDADETANTLMYASRMANIRNR